MGRIGPCSLIPLDPLLMYLQVHPMFDGLRDDPRSPELLRRVNLLEGS